MDKNNVYGFQQNPPLHYSLIQEWVGSYRECEDNIDACTRVYLALKYNDAIVFAMSMICLNEKQSIYLLHQCCTSIENQVYGGISKSIRVFIQDYNPNELLSFSPVELFSGCSLLSADFEHVGFVLPQYFWVERNRDFWMLSPAEYQSKTARENLLDFENRIGNNHPALFKRALALPDNTSDEELYLEAMGVKVYNCGYNVYRWTQDTLSSK